MSIPAARVLVRVSGMCPLAEDNGIFSIWNRTPLREAIRGKRTLSKAGGPIGRWRLCVLPSGSTMTAMALSLLRHAQIQVAVETPDNCGAKANALGPGVPVRGRRGARAVRWDRSGEGVGSQ